MATKKKKGHIVYSIGQDILRKQTRKVPKITPRIKEIIEELWYVRNKCNGAGIAAPQIGVDKKIIVVDTGLVGQCGVFINPEITWKSDTIKSDPEGCLSIPGVMCHVWRPTRIKVKAMNEEGNVREVDADGVFAKALQHEIDHLNGILMIDYQPAEERKMVLDFFKVKEDSIEYELLKNEPLGPTENEKKEKPVLYDARGREV